MITFLRDMLRTPDSQGDAHYWASVFGGHAWFLLGPWGVVALYCDMWTAAWLVPLLYLIFWEGAQFFLADARTRKLFWDCILDTVAVAFGCYAATFLGNGYQVEAILCWGASVGVTVAGVRVRS